MFSTICTFNRSWKNGWLAEGAPLYLRDKGISEEIITVVDILSKRHKDEDYDVFIGRICRNEIACRVKLADLKDNMDLSRIINPTAQDFERMEKYKRATTRVAEALQSFKEP